MLRFIGTRLLWMIPSLGVISVLAFVLIRLPPGDFVTNYIATLAASNELVDQNTASWNQVAGWLRHLLDLQAHTLATC